MNKKIILFGPPGSGKGTFSGQILKVLPEIVHVSTGDLFRYNLKNNTPIGLKAKEYMDKGALVPDEVVIEMVRDKLKTEEVKTNGYILDGFPRTLKQAQALSEMTEVDLLLLLKVSRDIIMKRILGRFGCKDCGSIYNKWTLPPKEKLGDDKWKCDKCGVDVVFEQRADDNEETLNSRLDVYKKNAKPLLEYYKSIIKEINAENTLEMTDDDIKKAIDM
jgi:adenylate kinase